MNSAERENSGMIVTWEKPESLQSDENDLAYADVKEKKSLENLEVLKQLKESLVRVQWMEAVYRDDFARTPIEDFVFEAEEIVFEAQVQERSR